LKPISWGIFKLGLRRDICFWFDAIDRRVTWNSESVVLSEINEHLDREDLFEKAGTVRHHGQKVLREVAEIEVVLDGTHQTRINGYGTRVREPKQFGPPGFSEQR
jgi:hypothetical protein